MYDKIRSALTRPQVRAIRLDFRVQLVELLDVERGLLEHVRARLALGDVGVAGAGFRGTVLGGMLALLYQGEEKGKEGRDAIFCEGGKTYSEW